MGGGWRAERLWREQLAEGIRAGWEDVPLHPDGGWVEGGAFGEGSVGGRTLAPRWVVGGRRSVLGGSSWRKGGNNNNNNNNNNKNNINCQ